MTAYEICRTPPFDADVAQLKKKFPRLEKDIEDFFSGDLSHRPRDVGDPIARVPHWWKARVGLPSHRISKRDGLRLIYRVVDDPKVVFALKLYHKAEMSTVTEAQVKRASQQIRPILEQKLIERGVDPKMLKL
jgi:mRNA-degrading endonuclease RelE of RelBE toxin-antitoxin system